MKHLWFNENGYSAGAKGDKAVKIRSLLRSSMCEDKLKYASQWIFKDLKKKRLKRLKKSLGAVLPIQVSPGIGYIEKCNFIRFLLTCHILFACISSKLSLKNKAFDSSYLMLKSKNKCVCLKVYKHFYSQEIDEKSLLSRVIDE